MTLLITDKDRRVIPRWRDARTTALLGELGSSGQAIDQMEITGDHFDHALVEWQGSRSIEAASDLVSSALVTNRVAEAAEAAKFLLQHEFTSPNLRRLAGLAVTGNAAPEDVDPLNIAVTGEQVASRGRIALLRSQLADYPRDPLLFADLAREYVLVGQHKPSVRAMEKALALAPTNRFVLRSAARLFVHTLDPERAHTVLRRSPATPGDPWLLAAEVAVSEVAGLPPLFIKAARRVLISQKFPASHLSELASALGTLEFQNGDTKKAKKLLRLSLSEPTENAVAQAAWVARRVSSLHLTEQTLSTPRSFEARAWQGFESKEWVHSVEQCSKWLSDEPFSNRPAELGSYIAAVALQDFAMCERFARRGLVANPGHTLLVNNLVVALANSGRLEDAWKLFRSIARPNPDGVSETTLLATEGLLLFRSGDPDAGRTRYVAAIESASGPSRERLRGLAAAHLAREEITANTPAARESLLLAEKEAGGANHPEVHWMLESLRKKLPVAMAE